MGRGDHTNGGTIHWQWLAPPQNPDFPHCFFPPHPHHNQFTHNSFSNSFAVTYTPSKPTLPHDHHHSFILSYPYHIFVIAIIFILIVRQIVPKFLLGSCFLLSHSVYSSLTQFTSTFKSIVTFVFVLLGHTHKCCCRGRSQSKTGVMLSLAKYLDSMEIPTVMIKTFTI